MEAYYDSGTALLKKGQPAKAALEFRNALKIKEDFIPALYSLGVAELQQGRFDSAVRMFLAVSERASQDVDSRLHLASILLMAGQFDSAQKYADQAYALRPSDAQVLAIKGAVALKRDNLGDAVRFADAALKLDPNNVDALIVRAAERLNASDPKAALSFLDRSGKGGQANVGLQLLRINVLSALKDQEGVETVIKSLVKSYPQEAFFRQGLVRWYLAQGRQDDAEKVLRQFATQNPDNIQAELDLVSFLRTTKGPDAGKAELTSRIQKSGAVFPFNMALAELTYQSGDYSGTVEQLRKLIDETDASSADGTAARLQLARVLIAKNDQAEAEKLVETVLASDNKNVDTLTLRAAMRIGRGRLADAIEDLRAASNEAPQSGLIMAMLADAYERNGDVTLAEDEYAQALKTQNSDVAVKYAQFLLRYGKIEQADRMLSDLSATSPRDRQLLTMLAQVKLAKQDWVAAQKASDALRELGGPDTNTADRILAAALAGEHKFDESLKLLEGEFSAGTKESGATVAALVQGYLRAGDPGKAEEVLKSILSSDPKDVQARVLLGSVYAAMKKPNEAEAAFKSAIASDPNAAVGYSALGEFYAQGKLLDQAVNTLREGLKHQPSSNVLRLLLAMTLEMSGQYDAAIAEYDNMLKADPHSTIAANNLAGLLAEHPQDAASLDRAYSIASRFADSGVPQFVDTLGWVYYLKGKYDQALLLLRKAADNSPDGNPSTGIIKFHLAMTYKELGLTDQAKQILQEAIELLPKNSPEGNKAQVALAQLASSNQTPENSKSTN